ncbi:MAG: DUF3795 domain-containing protein [Candidatus Aenigmarchaeota archaeon]|nr:DUF3795 domain-containing protein [Candidatus Aenigmarchaeota archaeon]
MSKLKNTQVNYPEIGVCGLSCRLCPAYQREGKSRCPGCKTNFRLFGPCPMLHCAIKKKGVEFCWECEESKTCEKWKKHRESGKNHDSFKCYQTLEKDINFIEKHGVKEFKKTQEEREELLKQMLKEFNEGRSKSYFCIAATVLEVDKLKETIIRAREKSTNLNIKEKSQVIHSILDDIAAENNYLLKLRK